MAPNSREEDRIVTFELTQSPEIIGYLFYLYTMNPQLREKLIHKAYTDYCSWHSIDELNRELFSAVDSMSYELGLDANKYFTLPEKDKIMGGN